MRSSAEPVIDEPGNVAIASLVDGHQKRGGAERRADVVRKGGRNNT